MRSIPAELLEKIQALNWSIYGNNNPVMEAVIVKAIKTLDIHTIRTETSLSAIDLAIQNDAENPVTLWLIAVVNKQAVVTTYDLTAETPDYETPTSTFTLATQEAGAAVRDVAIEFDGAWSGGVLITSGAPHLFWVERGVSLDKIWTVQWDGVGPQPAGTELLSEVR